MGLKNVETFGGMCKDICRCFMRRVVVEEGGDGSEVVEEFYSMFPTRIKEKSVRDVVNKAGGTNVANWRHWFCRACSKVDCDCKDEA